MKLVWCNGANVVHVLRMKNRFNTIISIIKKTNCACVSFFLMILEATIAMKNFKQQGLYLPAKNPACVIILHVRD